MENVQAVRALHDAVRLGGTVPLAPQGTSSGDNFEREFLSVRLYDLAVEQRNHL
jgi:hypothetical protein